MRILEQIRSERESNSTKRDAAKRRRTRWAPQTSFALVPAPGIPGVELPANIAALAATIDPNSAALQLELAKVRRCCIAYLTLSCVVDELALRTAAIHACLQTVTRRPPAASTRARSSHRRVSV